MGGPARKTPRTIEITLDLPHLALAGATVILLIGVAAALLRDEPKRVAPAKPREGGEVRDVSPGGTLFDRDEGLVVRRPERQVTPESIPAGGFELDLGVFTSRSMAEKVRQRASGVGVAAFVVGEGSGSFRVTAGPLATSEEARQAAAQLKARLGRPVQVRERRP